MTPPNPMNYRLVLLTLGSALAVSLCFSAIGGAGIVLVPAESDQLIAQICRFIAVSGLAIAMCCQLLLVLTLTIRALQTELNQQGSMGPANQETTQEPSSRSPSSPE